MLMMEFNRGHLAVFAFWAVAFLSGLTYEFWPDSLGAWFIAARMIGGIVAVGIVSGGIYWLFAPEDDRPSWVRAQEMQERRLKEARREASRKSETEAKGDA